MLEVIQIRRTSGIFFAAILLFVLVAELLDRVERCKSKHAPDPCVSAFATFLVQVQSFQNLIPKTPGLGAKQEE